MGRSAREPGRAEQPQRDHRRRLDLTGAVVTVDALHTQRATAEHLVEVTGADYIMTIKANQPRLLGAASAALAWPKTEFAEYSRRRCRASPDRPRRDPPRR